jgi:rhamnosyltransferase subunit B
MRIVIQTLGSAGDVHPFVGIGRALRARGHDVHLLANEVFRDLVEASGLAFVEAGDATTFRRSVDNPDLWHPRRGVGVVMRDGVVPGLEPAFEKVSALVVPGDTLVVVSTLGFAGHSAAEALSVPLAVADLAPSTLRSVYRAPRYPGLPLPRVLPAFLKRAAYRLVDAQVDGLVLPGLAPLRAKHGLPPIRRVFDRWLHAADLCLGLWPPWFAPRQPDWPANVRLTGFPLFDEGETTGLSDDLSAWLDAGDAPIVFTAGSANVFGGAYFRAGVDAAGRLGRRAVLVTQNPEVLPSPLPEYAFHAAYAPFSRLFPRAGCVVHHGGIGTTARALAAGVPSLVVPMAFDQLDNASHLADLGAGATLPARRFDARRARRALEAVLANPDVAAAAARARERIANEDARTLTCLALEAAGRSERATR